MSAHVAIVTGAPLCRNPRVVKEADALCEAGYQVTVLRPVLSAALAEVDASLAAAVPWQVTTTVDLTAGRAQPALARLARRAAMEAARRGVELPGALGYGVRQTLRLARATGADLFIGHQEVGLWVANRLAAEGRRVGVDVEDWYSEDLLAEARRARPLGLLRREEAAAVRRGGHVTTTSETLADGLAQAFGGPRPAVVYNAFPWADRERLDGQVRDRRQGDRSRLSLHWVSQTIGAGRGLDDVLEALVYVDAPVELHLRGTCSPGLEADLRRRLPTGHALFVHALVPPDELLSRIVEHDVGLALESHEPLSRDLTVTNKILHYLLAGLPVLASDTAGQREVAAKAPAAVQTFRAGDVRGLALLIGGFASDREALRSASAAALAASHDLFSWERQLPTLVASVERALAAPR